MRIGFGISEARFSTGAGGCTVFASPCSAGVETDAPEPVDPADGASGSRFVGVLARDIELLEAELLLVSNLMTFPAAELSELDALAVADLVVSCFGAAASLAGGASGAACGRRDIGLGDDINSQRISQVGLDLDRLDQLAWLVRRR